MTGYRVYRLVLATQPCTLASTTGYRVYRLVLATQPCTLASTTGYRVYRLVLATHPCTLASTYRLQVYKQGAGYTVLIVQGIGLHPNWNLYWLEALHQLMDKEWCSRASSKSLGFFNLAWFQNHTTIGDLF